MTEVRSQMSEGVSRRAFLRGGAAAAALAAVPGAAFASGGDLAWWGADYAKGPDRGDWRLVKDGRVILPAGTYTVDAVALCEVQHIARPADSNANLERYAEITICRGDA